MNERLFLNFHLTCWHAFVLFYIIIIIFAFFLHLFAPLVCGLLSFCRALNYYLLYSGVSLGRKILLGPGLGLICCLCTGNNLVSLGSLVF